MKLSSTLVFLFMICSTMQAQVFVKQDATGLNDGTSWENAFTDLQVALDASTSDDVIWVAAGTYVPQGPTPDSSHFVSRKRINLYGGFAGTESSLTERDWNANSTILSGDKLGDDIPGDFITNRTDNAHHVLIINAPETQSLIDGLIFESGTTRMDAFLPDADDIPYNRWHGGGLYLYRSGAIIRNSLFHNNDSGTRGSGIYALGDTLHTISLQIENVVFRDNDAYNGAAGFFHGYHDLSFKNCHFTNNTGYQGAALFFSGTSANVEDCVFESNSATFGGAINGYHTNIYIKHPVITISGSTFTNNTASGRGGGIIYNNADRSFSFSVDSCTFTGNETSPNGSGGGITVWDYSDPTGGERPSLISVSNSEFKSNTSGYGGGLELQAADDSIHVSVINNLFEGNSAYSGGGLSFWMAAEAKVGFALRSSTFRENTSTIGGGATIETSKPTNPLHYLVYDCVFIDNSGEVGAGAINAQGYPPHSSIGTIKNTSFVGNHGIGVGGAIYAFQQDLTIEDSYFLSNSTDATLDTAYHGGGAITMDYPSELTINRSIFEGNKSLTDGSAISIGPDVSSFIGNSLFHHHEGNSTIYNAGNLSLRNITMVENEGGLFLQTAGSTEVQNSIFDNQGDNLEWIGKAAFISKGGNISSDATMENLLTGHGSYTDLNNTNPLLGPDFVPVSGSPAIDLGNVEGIKNEFDLAGNARVQGGAIDAGSFESFLSATHDAVWNAPQLSIFPNPVKEVLNVKINVEWTGEVELMVYNQAGQQVHQANINKTHTNEILQSDIHNLVPGEYFLLVRANNEAYATNLVIAR